MYDRDALYPSPMSSLVCGFLVYELIWVVEGIWTFVCISVFVSARVYLDFFLFSDYFWHNRGLAKATGEYSLMNYLFGNLDGFTSIVYWCLCVSYV
jgi:hypothetical protein